VKLIQNVLYIVKTDRSDILLCEYKKQLLLKANGVLQVYSVLVRSFAESSITFSCVMSASVASGL
jgi:hypothetical protein